jgi:hypothetical protein
MMPRATLSSASRRIALGILPATLAAAVSASPPLVVIYRPQPAPDSSGELPGQATKGVEVKAEGLVFLLPPMRFDRRYATLNLHLHERHQSLTIRTDDMYIVSENGQRINLFGLQYQTSPNIYVTAYSNGWGKNKLAASYIIEPQVEWLEFIFDFKTQEIGRTAILHLEGIETENRVTKVVCRYELDCENLGKDWPLLDRWFSMGKFSRYCEQ